MSYYNLSTLRLYFVAFDLNGSDVCCSIIGRFKVLEIFELTETISFIGECCSYRLSDFNVRIGEYGNGNPDANEACVVNQNSAGELSKFIPCRPVRQGRYLYVQQNLNEALTLCEVEVYGTFIGI